MQRVYLLLRNNRESGPHSAAELEQMGLQPHDLIWVEGTSLAWTYPAEIAALKHLVPAPAGAPASTPVPEPVRAAQPAPVASKQAPQTHVFVSLPQGRRAAKPVDEIEARAAALRQKLVETPDTVPATATLYQRSLEAAEEDYGAWLLADRAQKRKKRNLRRAVGGAVVVAGLGAGWWVGRIAYDTPVLTLAQQSSQMAKQTPVQQKSTPPASQTFQLPATQVAITDSAAVRSNAVVEKAKRVADKKSKPPVFAKPLPAPTADSELAAVVPVAEASHTTVPEANPAQTQPATIEETPKKKGFFASLFGKKKKDDAPKTRVDITGQVSLRLKENSEAWMMGIHDARLVLRNESKADLKEATIEIAYLNDHNSVLEKRTVVVNGVDKGKSKTIAVPDHRTASRLTYLLVAAAGEE